MTPSAVATLSLRLRDAWVCHLAAPAPGAEDHALGTGALRDRRDVEAAVLVVRDEDGAQGCWGPLTAELADAALGLAGHLLGTMLAEPGEVVRRARELDRHAHTGRGAVTAGALELACWDLLGQRQRVPVWRLLAEAPALADVPIYATCFGTELDSAEGLELAARLGAAGLVQKWRPATGPHRVRAYAQAGAALPAGEPLLSLDFEGRLSARESSAHCGEVAAVTPLAWVEEAAPPGQLASLAAERFPCPLAAGEHCYTEDELHLLASLGVTIWQPDAVFCGGLRRYLRGVELARKAGAALLPHGGGLLVALHAAAVAEPAPIIEYHLLLEPRRQAHLAARVAPTADGALPLPQLPGWNGEPDWEVLRR